MIKADKQWMEALKTLIDSFLKCNWLNWADFINQVRASITPVEEEKPVEEKTKEEIKTEKQK